MPIQQLTDVAPTKPVSPYIGGKRNLAKRLVELINETPHTTYAEPFVGMGGVFLRRNRRPPAEIINDWSRDVSNLFRVVRSHLVPFLDLLALHLADRSEFERQQLVAPETLTDLQRAVRFFYLQRTAFGGKVSGRNFGVSKDRVSRFDVTALQGDLRALHDRLANVTIERLPWRAFIERYDGPGTLFYLDPPYFGCEDDYGPGLFSRAEFVEMAEVLARIQGRFILSLNDRPAVREIFAAFDIEAVGTTYSVGKGNRPAGELIIRRVPGSPQGARSA